VVADYFPDRSSEIESPPHDQLPIFATFMKHHGIFWHALKASLMSSLKALWIFPGRLSRYKVCISVYLDRIAHFRSSLRVRKMRSYPSMESELRIRLRTYPAYFEA
jgi:hypothetical protein